MVVITIRRYTITDTHNFVSEKSFKTFQEDHQVEVMVIEVWLYDLINDPLSCIMPFGLHDFH